MRFVRIIFNSNPLNGHYLYFIPSLSSNTRAKEEIKGDLFWVLTTTAGKGIFRDFVFF